MQLLYLLTISVLPLSKYGTDRKGLVVYTRLWNRLRELFMSSDVKIKKERADRIVIGESTTSISPEPEYSEVESFPVTISQIIELDKLGKKEDDEIPFSEIDKYISARSNSSGYNLNGH
jgi:hypothetical protein